MKIVAFDSECTRDFGMHCEMCMFGYVMCDQDLKVMESKQIYINANKPTGRSKQFLRSDMDKVKDAPPYKKVRPQIAGLLSGEDTLFISHSPEATFRYLCLMDRHINAKPMICKAYDLYTIVRNYADISSYGLSDIARTFNIPYRGKESNVDAKTCIRILEYLCKEERTDITGLLSICGKGAEVDSEIIYHNTLLKVKRERLFSMYDKKTGKGMFDGIVFSMAEAFENNRISSGFRIADYILANGGTLTKKVTDSQVFIWDGDVNSKRLESVNLMPEGTIRVMESPELFSLKDGEPIVDKPSEGEKPVGQTLIDDY